jgi:Spy/CpxP family protein refolding chaperone
MASMAYRMGIVATVLFGAMAIGCGGSSANTPATAAATAPGPDDDDAMAGVLEHHRYHHHGGVTLFVAMSLDTLAVSPEQRAAVEKIRADLHARMDPARMAEQGLMATLADGLAAGNLDPAKVDADVAQVTAAAAAVHDASVDALNELHAVLTPPQRAALVDKVESHWAVWQNANARDNGPGSGGRMATLAAELDLTPDQVNKIQADFGERMKAVPAIDPREVSTHIHAFGDAFRGEKFDARGSSTANGANARMAGGGATHLALLVEAMSPVLTPGQRAGLAQILRAHATHDPNAQGNP